MAKNVRKTPLVAIYTTLS